MALFTLTMTRQVELFKRHRTGILYLVSLVGFLVFVSGGAAVFWVLEADEYEESQKAVLEAKDKIRKKYPQVSGKIRLFLIYC